MTLKKNNYTAAIGRLQIVLEHRLQPTCRLLSDAIETAADHPDQKRHLELVKYLAQQAAVDLELIQREAFDAISQPNLDNLEQPHDSEGGAL